MLVKAGFLVILVILVLFLVFWPKRATEHYDADTGLEWLQKSLLSLDPSLCVESVLAVDTIGIREGKYTYLDSPADTMVYKEMLQGERDIGSAFVRTDNSSGTNRATISLDPKSPYFDVLSNMDDNIQKNTIHLSNISPWYLKGVNAADVSFSKVSDSVLASVSKTPDGLVLWEIKEAVANDPQGKAIDVFTLLSFARLLLMINYSVRDMNQIKQGKLIEDNKTSSFMSNLSQAEKDVKQSLDSETLLANQNLRNSDIENENELKRISGYIMDSRIKTSAANTGTTSENMKYNTILQQSESAKTRNYDVQKSIETKSQNLDDIMEDVTRLENSATKTKLDVELRLSTALGELDDIDLQRTALNNQISDASSKVNQLSRDLVFWQDPARLNASNADANLAYQALEDAKTELSDLKEDRERLKKKKDIAQKKVDQLYTDLGTSKDLEKTARTGYETANTNLINAQSRLEASQYFVEESKAIDEQRIELESELNDLKIEIGALTTKLSTMKRVGSTTAYENALNLLGQLKAKYQSLTETLDEGLNYFEAESNKTELQGITKTLTSPGFNRPVSNGVTSQPPTSSSALNTTPTTGSKTSKEKKRDRLSSIMHLPSKSSSPSKSSPTPAPPPAKTLQWQPLMEKTTLDGIKSYKNKELDQKRKQEDAVKDCRAYCDSESASGCRMFILENPKSGNYKCWLGKDDDTKRAVKKDDRKITQFKLLT